jgi:hypothetical protein
MTANGMDPLLPRGDSLQSLTVSRALRQLGWAKDYPGDP